MGEAVTVAATGNALSYTWRNIVEGDEIATSTGPVWENIPEVDGINVFEVTGQIGNCFGKAEDTVYVRLPIDIPTAFTPNGDNINDIWVIQGLDLYPNAKLRVYNRWGHLVYQQLGGYNTPWDGTRNGKILGVGTYYYTLEVFEEEVKPITGTVTIIQ